MALLTRELELIIIAHDQASSVVARVAGALTFIGTAIAGLGVAVAQEFGEMTQEAIAFEQDASLAFTQMFDRSKGSIEGIKDIMLDTLRAIPVETESMGEAVFDIFSSLPVGMEEAQKILEAGSMAAVAGGIDDIRLALTPTIASMNAWGLGIEDIDRILDSQFETVQRGIITYDEFASNFGKVIPTAAAAGQELETAGAAMAFLTARGLNASMAATSTARAFELFADPDTVARLEEAGIAVRDQTGEYRQLHDVLRDASAVFDGLTAPERKELFQELFGNGRIQARRFFDLAIPGWEEFGELVDGQVESAGAFEEAYAVMSETSQAKLQELKNAWEGIRLEIGERLVPLLVDTLLPILERVVFWWDNLTEAQKDSVIEVAKWATIGTVIFGVFTALAGIGLLISQIWGSVAPVLATAGGVLLKFAGWIGLIAGAVIFLWQNWDKVVQIWNDHVVPAIEKVIAFLQPYWEWLKKIIDIEFEKTMDTLGEAWEKVAPVLRDVWETIIKPTLESLAEWFTTTGLPHIVRLWQNAWDFIAAFVRFVFTGIRIFIEVTANIIQAVWQIFGEGLANTWRIIWENILVIVEGFLNLLHGIQDFFISIFTGDWKRFKNSVHDILLGLFQIVGGTIRGIVLGALSLLTTLLTGGRVTFDELVIGIKSALDRASEWVSGFVTDVGNFFQGLWDRLRVIVAGIRDTVSRINPWVPNSPPIAPQILAGVTDLVSQYEGKITGLKTTALKAAADVAAAYDAATNVPTFGIGTPVVSGGNSVTFGDIITQGSDPADIVDEISWQFATGVNPL